MQKLHECSRIRSNLARIKVIAELLLSNDHMSPRYVNYRPVAHGCRRFQLFQTHIRHSNVLSLREPF